ncbi:unnamed protein product [Chironomus riparius]|uniref:ZAD domain-containing protein n=1 Tax=Chironomus riparius TaxID=315576 RepID=A0A9N9RYZ8_9DIPT|nr:unnamed protein product [Chironomus riparius]
MDNNIKIDSVFEEKYCICGHYSIDKFTCITNSFIKYRAKLISLVEIIRETLCYEPALDNSSSEICDLCKTKLLDFYNFKMRSFISRENFQKSTDNSEKKMLQILEDPENSTIEYKMIDIIRNFIKTHSISRIEVEENSKKFLVISGCSQEPREEIVEPDPSTNIETEKIDDFEPEKLDKSEELELDCIEEFLDDNEDSIDGIDSTENEIGYEEVVEFQVDTDTSSLSNTASLRSSSLKRSRHPDEWQCNKRKKLRNSGKSYLNSKGRLVKERNMLESCAVTNCRSNCQSRLTEIDRLMNFDNYWKLGNIVEQRKFIYNHILSKEPSRRKTIQSNRTVTLQFHLDVLDSQGNQACVQVCKKMFKNTLAISNQVIQGVVTKYGNSGFTDDRGRHKRKLTEAQELARKHVQNFPFFYVEQSMTKVQLYNMYVNDCKKNAIEPVKESNYREIFDKFNTNSFLKAEKVLCDKCHQFYQGTDEERESLQKELNQHLEESKKCKDRALGRIRHKRAMEKRKAEK